MRAVPVMMMLTLASALAGCSGDTGPDPDGSDDMIIDPDEPPSVDVPTWQVGDWWTFKDSFGSTWDLVVTGEEGSDYVLDTDSKTLAFYQDQVEDVSYFGLFSKAGLAGEEDGQRVDFFHFPLQDGDSWSMTLDGESLRAEAEEVGEGRYHIRAYEGELQRHEWMYDNATRFFEWLSLGDANGTEAYRIDLQDSGAGWTGEALRAHGDPFFNVQTQGPDAESGVFTDWSPAEGAEVWLSLTYACQEGEFTFAIGAAESIPNTNGVVDVTGNDDGGTWASPCPYSGFIFGTIGVDPENGNWGYVYDLASQDATLSATAWIVEFERITL